MIGKEVAHYKILDRLGGGGMGVVYKAEDTRLGRVVALKFLSAELLASEPLRRRFLHEARAASVIDHPNVCHVYEVGEADDGRAFMAMSYCEGRSLRDVIKDGPTAPREAFSIAFGIAQGLWAAHRRNIVHRDIKPANVILTDDGFVRIVDFGLALLIGDSRVTTSGVTVGTVAYMSPEQTSGSTVGPNTDIWSLGVTLYELLTGHLPFRGDVNAALVYSIVHEPHTPLPDSVPAPCVRIVNRCLEKEPARRYQTVEELLEDMVKAAQELGWESSVASATIAPILRERRRKVLTRRVAVAAAAILVVAGGWLAWQKWHIRSPYTTRVRLAVLPLKNMIGAGNQDLVDGMSEHIARVTRWEAHDHPSMWTVPYASVLTTDPPDAAAARLAFGANRVITGDVQRFEDQYRVTLELVDSKSGRKLNGVAIPFRLEAMQALPDSLRIVTSQLCGVTGGTRPSPWSCDNAQAAQDYFRNVAPTANTDEKTLARVVDALDRAAALDSLFAALVCADGNARLQLFKRNHNRATLAGALLRGRSARRLAPQLADAHLLIGDVFARMEKPDSAEACYKGAIAVEPGYVTAAQRLTKFYDGQKRIDEAERVLTDLVAARPDLWATHSNLGTFYFTRDRLEDAAVAYRSALVLAPADPRTLNNLGAVYHRRGQWAQARELFLRSFKARPNCESSSNVAVTYYFDGNYDEAAKYFEFALQYCDTTAHDPWGDLARALYWTANGRARAVRLYGKALGLAQSALSQSPDDISLMSSVIDYEAMVDHADSASAMIERVKPLLKDDERAMYRIGAVEEKLGRREAALDLLADAVRHGFPVAELRGDPLLKSLVSDSRFQQMVSTEAAADGAQAAKSAH